MRKEFQLRIAAYKKGDPDDTIGLFAIINWIERQFPGVGDSEIKKLTLEFVRDMVSEGFQAGNPEYSPTGYVP